MILGRYGRVYGMTRVDFGVPAPGWLCLAALLVLALPGIVRAADTAPPQDARSDANWLQAVQNAARHQSFSGTIVYQRGDEVHASRVVQHYDGVETRARVVTLDGQPREFIRNGDEVQCLYPHLHRIVVERGGVRAFPAFAEPLASDVLSHYALRRLGKERVAGSTCDVVELVPRDNLRYGYRLWVEPNSGLLFKAQTLNEHGAVLEQIAFTDVRVGEPVDPALLKPSWSTAGWTVDRQQAKAIELRQQGWSVTAPSGFHRLAEVVRHFSGQGDTAPRAALQAVFSDGLATVSVFIEPEARMQAEPEESQRRGPVTAFSRQVGEARVTVVGEVPPATAQSIAESVVYSAPPH
ncbi:MAG TPA: MucB/RseB C-terminal domain-containing protein [Burkholderiaceae bacterium]|nr:MucB/RseB C-terminal domain-containing protein [Burkholderiaceae bacterium]